MEPLDVELDETEVELPTEPMLVNVGPAHPAMHGTVRCVMELSGESIRRVDVQVGYLHRGFEKMCERGTWGQVFPYVDRCNYVSPMLNNVGFSMACEKMLGIEATDRCQWYRMALGELARISDHLTCDGAMAMELGAFTPFLWRFFLRRVSRLAVRPSAGFLSGTCYSRIVHRCIFTCAPNHGFRSTAGLPIVTLNGPGSA